MVEYVFAPPPVPSLAIRGQALHYPVSRIFCVGRNYEDHAREMGSEVDREKPFYFTKNPLALVTSGSSIPYPPGTDNYHYEMEMVVAIGTPAFRVSASNALAHVFGYACGLDMTRRDLQLSERAKQRPWDLGKDVEFSAPVSEIVPVGLCGHPVRGRISLSVNGQMRQDSDISQLVWSVPDIIAHLSQFYHLAQGDLIFTGTPAGVGAVQPGDVLKGAIEGIGTLDIVMGAAT